MTYKGNVNLPSAAAKKASNSTSTSNRTSADGEENSTTAAEPSSSPAVEPNSSDAKDKTGASASAAAPAAASEGSRAPLVDVPCCVDGIAGSGSVVAAAAKNANNSMQCRGCR